MLAFLVKDKGKATMRADTFDSRSRFNRQKISRRDSFKNRAPTGRNLAVANVAPTDVAQFENRGEPHWEVLYSPNDARRDRIAFSIALAVMILTLALTNLGVLR